MVIFNSYVKLPEGIPNWMEKNGSSHHQAGNVSGISHAGFNFIARKYMVVSESDVGMKRCCWYLAVCQNLVPLVNIKIAGKWMFIPLKMVLIGIDPYPLESTTKRLIARMPWATLLQRLTFLLALVLEEVSKTEGTSKTTNSVVKPRLIDHDVDKFKLIHQPWWIIAGNTIRLQYTII